MPSLDIHAHMYPRPYVDYLERKGGESARLAKRLESRARTLSRWIVTGTVEEHTELMSAAGVDRQVVSITTQSILVEDKAASAEHAEAANDAMAEVCAQAPDRLFQFAVLPLLDADAALRELDRVSKDLGVVGITLPTHILGLPLDWEGMEPIYAEIEARKLPIFLHAAQPNHRVVAPGFNDYGIFSSVYFPAEDSNALLRMVYGGVLERYPDLRVICAHAGGVLPLWIDRAESRNDPGATNTWDLPHPTKYYLSKIKYDTATTHAPTIRCACETFGLSQIVFGTDYPCEDMREITATIDRLNLSDADRHAILEGNLAEWFPSIAALDQRVAVPALAR